MQWVRLLCIQYVSENGRQVVKQPGEWVRVGRQQAEAWIAAGQADRPDMPDLSVLPGCGVLLWGGGSTVQGFGGVELVKADEPRLEFARTFIWSGVNFRGDLLSPGFHALDTWEIAAPVFSYEKLARDLGDEEDRERTINVVRDLRVPVYDTRMLFVRRCAATRRLIKEWLADAGHRDLAFLRALYRVKPLVLALPATWVLA